MGLLDALGTAGLGLATGGASLTPMLVGAGLGFAKSQFIDKPAEKKSADLSANIMRYSPWSGIKPPDVKRAPGAFSSALQGAALGSMYNPTAAAGAVGDAAGAANAGTAPLAQGASVAASPLAQASKLSPMAGASASPWFNVQNPMYPYSR